MNENKNSFLCQLGWNNFFAGSFASFRDRPGQNFLPARIARESKHLYLVYCEKGEMKGEMKAEVSGKMRHEAKSKSDFPAVGDWVVIQPQAVKGEGGEGAEGARAIIHALLPRQSIFSRKEAWVRTEEQVVAANIETVFIVNGLDSSEGKGRAFNLRRIERYLTLAYNSKAEPVIILNKADLCEDLESKIAAAESVAFDVPIHAVSALEGWGMEELDPYLKSGMTVAFLGSSGVGKSSLINCLLGTERQKVKEIREKDTRGRHTTTERELICLPSGAMVIDTPGMRELQLWGEEDSLEESFEDIKTFAGKCRFRDCKHESEPGCAIHEALGNGELDTARFESYLDQRKEMKYLESRSNYLQEKKERFKKISQWSRKMKKQNRNK